MCHRWLTKGWHIFGTYRTESKAVEELKSIGANLVTCDLRNKNSLEAACADLRRLCPRWDALVLCPGTQEPVDLFIESKFDEWDNSIKINFTNQLRIVHELLPNRSQNNKTSPCVLLFAGGGTNNATVNYSAYTISKIALIKMCELLDAEIPDTRFVTIGPGWVKTKIHESTLKAGSQAGANYQRTLKKLESNECTPMEYVLDCCDWLIDSPREVISGKNFSVVFDAWNTDELVKMLKEDKDMYKLRRYGNDFLMPNKPNK